MGRARVGLKPLDSVQPAGSSSRSLSRAVAVDRPIHIQPLVSTLTCSWPSNPWIKIERSRLIGPFREKFGPRNSGGIVAVRFHLTVRVAHKWGTSPNVSGRSSPPVSNLLTRVRLALKGLSPTNLTHLARAALLSLSGWWASFHWVVSYLRLSLSRPCLRHCRAAGASPGGFPVRHCPPGRYSFNARHLTAPGALSHGFSTCLAWP